jgi:hypothetical protein
MENDKKWKKPEMTILFSGNVKENLMSENVLSESGDDDGGGGGGDPFGPP